MQHRLRGPRGLTVSSEVDLKEQTLNSTLVQYGVLPKEFLI